MRFLLPVAAVLFSSSIAAAQAPGQTLEYVPDDEPITAPAVQVETVSYRKQVLLADGLSVTAIAIAPMFANSGGGEAGGKIAMLGVAGYIIGAPLVHLAHGRGGAAFKSLGLRTALPMLGALAGFKLGPNDLQCAQSDSPEGGHGGGGCEGSISGAIGGLLIGSIAAATIDAKYLASYETMRTVPTWSASVQHVPGGGMTVGLSGGF